MRSTYLLARVAALLATPLLIGAFASPASATLPAVADVCVIQGHTVDAITGAPAVDGTVAAYTWDSALNAWRLVTWDNTRYSGEIYLRIDHSEPMVVVLAFRGGTNHEDQVYKGLPLAWDDLWGTWPERIPDNASMRGAVRIPLDDWYVQVGDVKLRPRPTTFGAISGQVTEQFGSPLRQMVRVWQENSETGTWTPTYWANTDLNGVYTYRGTADRPLVGRAKVEFGMGPEGTAGFFGGRTLETARVVTIRPGQHVYGISEVVHVGGRITGRFMNTVPKTPAALSNATAYGIAEDGSPVDSGAGGQAISNGTYVVGTDYGMGPGVYVLSAGNHPGFWAEQRYLPYFYGQTFVQKRGKRIQLPEGGTVADCDVWFSRVAAVAGKVNNEHGVGLPDVLAQVYQVSATGTLKLVGSDYTDSFGMYRVLCPGAGSYTVRFVDQAGTSVTGDDGSAWLGGGRSGAAATRLAVPRNDVAVHAPFVLVPVDAARASRVYGLNAYETALAASREAFAAGETTSVVVASGSAFADAISGSNISGATESPILLTYSGTIYPGLLEEFERLGAKTVYLMGGPATISVRQEKTLTALGYDVVRLGGADRYQVNANALLETDELSGIDASTTMFVASGAVYPDALAIAPAVYSRHGGVALVGPGGAPASVTKTLKRLGVKRLYGVGGTASLTPAAVNGLKTAGANVTRIASGRDRYETAALFGRAARSRGWLTGKQVGIASGLGFADALIAGPALGRTGGLLLLTRPDSLPASTASALTSMKATSKRITVYGSTGAVSSRVLVQTGSK